ncbi:DUF397 domain-containing protein [Streptomyces sp. NPDC004435]|uniref:DUF397 domain-containing protein n=1 Tax=Streptomyces sp. NPDC004435 TaxID=3364701 RepID=UPI003695E6B4
MNTSPATTPNTDTDFTWVKSSYSSDGTGNCVEVANTLLTHAAVHVRDSKVPTGPRLKFTPQAFSAFVGAVGDGAADPRA